MVDKRRELNSRLLQIETVSPPPSSAASTATTAIFPDASLFSAAAEQISSPPVMKGKGILTNSELHLVLVIRTAEVSSLHSDRHSDWPEIQTSSNPDSCWNLTIQRKYSAERRPNCQRCAQHSVLARLKGHKRCCPFRDCPCAKCQVVQERQKLMADQVMILK